ncbi:MAG: hypothetical protein ABJJ38_06750, partial [Roseibium sp.]|uniref:hypothetical protein n=1 Tax=Roseibium sp. TaxID=1936156 RepID=UPI0032994BF0
LIIQNKADCSFTYFSGKLVRRFAHGAPSYSGVGASGKPGAVQTHGLTTNQPIKTSVDNLPNSGEERERLPSPWKRTLLLRQER